MGWCEKLRNLGQALLYNGTTDFILDTVTVPLEAGTDGITPAFNVLELPFVYNAMIPLKGGWSLRARAKTTLTDSLTFTAILADY